MQTKQNKDFIEPKLSPVLNYIGDKNWYERFFLWRLNNRNWMIIEDWVVWSDYLQLWVKIPKGFIFDGASVPKMFQSVVNSVDALFYGSILHDFIYRFDQLIVCYDDNQGEWFLQEKMGRKAADMIMKELSIQLEGVHLPANIGFIVLSPVGHFAWNKWRKKNYKLSTPYPFHNNKHLKEAN